MTIIDTSTIGAAVDGLAHGNEIIKRITAAYGLPPAWRRAPGFSSLVYTILEQQVSLASARAVYERLLTAAVDLTPVNFLKFDDTELRSIGFSRQKTLYCGILARRILAGELDLAGLAKSPDDEIRTELMKLKGIGRWTADIYLLHSLGRPDVWPTGDLALRIAVQEEMALPERLSEEETADLGEPFRPLRSVAARVFWHSYLCRRGIREVT